jgi:hypothetical protein
MPVSQHVVHNCIPMRVIRTALLALLAAAFVALPAQAFARASYFCHMTGQVSESHCCAGKHVSARCGAQIEQQDCCALMLSEGHGSAPATRVSSPHVAAAALLGTMAAFVALGSVKQPHARATPDLHPPGPARFLAHCAFLI